MKNLAFVLFTMLSQKGIAQFIPINYAASFPATDTPGYYNVYPWHQDSAWLYVNNNRGIDWPFTNSKLYRTANQGVNWQYMNLTTSKPFVFYAQNGQKVVIAHSEGKVAISDNACQSWDSIYQITPGFFLQDGGHCLFRKDDTIAIYTVPDTLQITTNRGAHWQTIILPFRSEQQYFYFLNSRVFYAYCDDDSSLYKTSNSGNSWTKLWTYPIINKNTLRYLNANFGKKLSVPNEGLIFLMSACKVFRLENDGQSSTMIKQHIQKSAAGPFSGIHFLNRDTGFACSWNYMLRTINGGTTWEYFPNLPMITTFLDIRFAPGNTIGYYCQSVDNTSNVFVPARILNLGGTGTPDTMISTGLEQISEIGINVFPVPSSGLLHITNESNFIERVELLTLQGIKLQEYLIKTTDAELDLKNVKNGIYFIRIYSKNGDIINRKIIKIE